MVNILIIETNKRLRDLIGVAISSELKVNILYATIYESLSLLQENKEIDLVVLRTAVSNESESNEVLSILNYLMKEDVDRFSVLTIGNMQMKRTNFGVVQDKFKMEELLSEVFRLIKKSRSAKMQAMELSEYSEIPIEYFSMIENVSCDIFIKLKKMGKEQYIKRLNAGDSIDEDTIDRYRKSSLESLYIKSEYRFTFMNVFLNNALEKLDMVDAKKPELSYDLLSDTFIVTREMLEKELIDTRTREIVDKTISKMTDSIAHSVRLGPLIKNLFDNPGSFLFRHSYFIGALAYKIIEKMDWGSKKQLASNFEKMIFVCFFHDIMLEDDLAMINSRADLYKTNLGEDDTKKVLEHANKAATLIQSYSKAPSGVDVIIRQHHGMSNGVGFTEQYTSNLSAMAVVFIVLEEFALMVFGFNKEQDSIKEFFKHLYDKFHIPSYRKVVDALYEVVLEIHQVP